MNHANTAELFIRSPSCLTYTDSLLFALVFFPLPPSQSGRTTFGVKGLTGCAARDVAAPSEELAPGGDSEQNNIGLNLHTCIHMRTSCVQQILFPAKDGAIKRKGVVKWKNTPDWKCHRVVCCHDSRLKFGKDQEASAKRPWFLSEANWAGTYLEWLCGAYVSLKKQKNKIKKII